MISLELAKQLKDAGLKWEPKFGDFFMYPGDDKPSVYSFKSSISDYITVSDEEYPEGRITTLRELLNSRATWLPTLTDILSEMVRRGYLWETAITRADTCPYITHLNEKDGQYINTWWGDTPEETAGKALLWVLQQVQTP